MSNDNQTSFFDLHTNGIAYLNRFRKVPVAQGQPFYSVDLSALRGSSENVQYTRYDCRISGSKALEILQGLESEILDNDTKVLVGFRLGDAYPEAFVYKGGDKDGETGVGMKGRLLKIKWAKVNGEFVYKDEAKDVSEETAEASDSTPESDELPQEVLLAQDDPNFADRLTELQSQGYKYDQEANLWRLPVAA